MVTGSLMLELAHANDRIADLEAEIARLRELVRDAYEEGWDDAFFWSEDIIKPAGCDEDWNVSQAKKALEINDE